MIERWADVSWSKGLYQVSTSGDVKSLPRVVTMVDGRRYRVRGGILKKQPNGRYRQVTLCIDGAHVYPLVHRLVLEAFVGPCPPGMECRHLNGRRDDNRLVNLTWGTKDEQINDKRCHGTLGLGERNGNSCLTVDLVVDIRARHSLGESMRQIAKSLRIDKGTVKQVVSRITWKHV